MRRAETLAAAQYALEDAQIALRYGMPESAAKLLLAVDSYLRQLVTRRARRAA